MKACRKSLEEQIKRHKLPIETPLTWQEYFRITSKDPDPEGVIDAQILGVEVSLGETVYRYINGGTPSTAFNYIGGQKLESGGVSFAPNLNNVTFRLGNFIHQFRPSAPNDIKNLAVFGGKPLTKIDVRQ
jgi:hypothetical protein